MQKLVDIPGPQTMIVAVPGQATAATPDEFVLGVMPSNAVITAVTYAPKTLLTGAVTNFCSVTCRNRTGAGAGAVNIAQVDYSSGAVTAAAFVANPITLNATLANRNVALGDVLTCEKLVTGTGLAMPAGTVTVTYQVR